jgi:hypothetical protein
VPSRLAPPGPSFLREQEFQVAGRLFRAGMGRPASAPDAWWVTVLWVADADGVPSFSELLEAGGRAIPVFEPPLARLGPVLVGSLAGLILEENGRTAIRLALVASPDDEARPWAAPAAVRAAFRWEPMRVATMRPNELASAVLTGFRRSVETVAGR